MKTKSIIKALTEGGLDINAFHGVSSTEVEIFVNNGEGCAEEKKTKKALKLATKILGWKGGYRTGYGAFVMQKNPIDMGDFGDKGSRWHY